jgi:serpin B
LSLLAACGDSGSSDAPEVKSDLARNTAPNVSGGDLAALVAGDTQFATDLYGLARTNPGNLFMSPHSISAALAMTYAGARGTTATQIADVFGFTPTVHSAQNALDLALASRGQNAHDDTIPFKLTTANSIWGQEGKEFQAEFLDTLALNYGAGLHVLDFLSSPDPSRLTINAWVADHTNDKIPNLLPEGSVSADTRLVLTNAVYFSAAWQNPFKAEQTSDRPFQVTGSNVSVPTMAQNEEMGYAEGDGWTAAEVPYDGGELSMTVVVPSGDLSTLEASLSPALLEQITTTRVAQVDFQIPKFKYSAPLGLTDALQTLGMLDAFGPSADFSGIDGTQDLVIQDVIHEGFIGINEAGTEAAAATAVLIGDTAAPEQRTLHADKPFLFFIRDIQTKEILFIGRVVDPR